MFGASHKSKAVHVNESNFEEKVLQSPVPVLVDFYAEWCGPCRMLAPVLEEVAGETDQARVAKVNVDESPGLAQRYRVSSIPSLKVFSSGSVTGEHVGLADKRHLKQMLGVE